MWWLSLCHLHFEGWGLELILKSSHLTDLGLQNATRCCLYLDFRNLPLINQRCPIIQYLVFKANPEAVEDLDRASITSASVYKAVIFRPASLLFSFLKNADFSLAAAVNPDSSSFHALIMMLRRSLIELFAFESGRSLFSFEVAMTRHLNHLKSLKNLHLDEEARALLNQRNLQTNQSSFLQEDSKKFRFDSILSRKDAFFTELSRRHLNDKGRMIFSQLDNM